MVPISEGGLLGIAVYPHFKNNHLAYLYYTYRRGGEYYNKVVRYELINDQLENSKTIIDNIPAANNHDGGRIHFGPDGFLYISTGDAGKSETAQDIKSLAGKILRVKEDGTIPKNNIPFQDRLFIHMAIAIRKVLRGIAQVICGKLNTAPLHVMKSI